MAEPVRVDTQRSGSFLIVFSRVTPPKGGYLHLDGGPTAAPLRTAREKGANP
jgi:hypothetical protein